MEQSAWIIFSPGPKTREKIELISSQYLPALNAVLSIENTPQTREPTRDARISIEAFA
jgi:hypothetical protein